MVLFNIIADLKYRSYSTGQGVQLTAPLINYQTTHIPLDLIEHFVTKRLGLGDTFNGYSFICTMATCTLTCGNVTAVKCLKLAHLKYCFSFLRAFILYLSTGYYMYIDTSGLRQCVENVKLSSSPLKFLRNMCLKFYYRIDGADAGSLNVTIDGKLLFSASNLYVENIWLEAGINTSSITGSLMGTHRVNFLSKISISLFSVDKF